MILYFAIEIIPINWKETKLNSFSTPALEIKYFLTQTQVMTLYLVDWARIMTIVSAGNILREGGLKPNIL